MTSTASSDTTTSGSLCLQNRHLCRHVCMAVLYHICRANCRGKCRGNANVPIARSRRIWYNYRHERRQRLLLVLGRVCRWRPNAPAPSPQQMGRRCVCRRRRLRHSRARHRHALTPSPRKLPLKLPRTWRIIPGRAESRLPRFSYGAPLLRLCASPRGVDS